MARSSPGTASEKMPSALALLPEGILACSLALSLSLVRRGQASFNEGKFYRRKKELTDDQLTEIQDSFDLFVKDDKDAGDIPKIDAEDLLVVMRALGHEPSPGDLKKLVQEVDEENTGQLAFNGYLNIILNKMAERPSSEDLDKAFRLFDPQGKRRIDFNDLKRIAGQIGEQIEDDELEDMIKEADHSGTGEIGHEDFVKIVTSYAKHYDGDR